MATNMNLSYYHYMPHDDTYMDERSGRTMSRREFEERRYMESRYLNAQQPWMYPGQMMYGLDEPAVQLAQKAIKEVMKEAVKITKEDPRKNKKLLLIRKK